MLKTFALFAALLSLAPASRADNCKPAPLGDATLYLRGGLNNWAAQDEHAFEYRCDAYYLNLAAKGTQEFKISDEDWTASLTFGGDAKGNPARGATGNLKRDFSGEHTLRLAIGRRRWRHTRRRPQDLQAPRHPRPSPTKPR